ncbi:MAG: SDR family oxidoreductase [Pseudomonadota bacterium]
MSHLQGKSVLVTGASRGIGEATARHFAAEGAVVTLAARSLSAIEAIADEITDAGGQAKAVACDVADPAAVASAVEIAGDGSLDILINNAGVIEPIARIDQSDPAAWGQVVDVNLKGVYYAVQAALPGMIAKGAGVILTIGSGAAHGPLEGWSHYCATKAAVLMLNRSIEKEYGGLGIRAINLSPGTVATEMQREIKASGMNPVSQLDWDAHIPPDWPAKALAWLSGPEGEEFAGEEVSLRDLEIRRRVGLIPG